MAFAVKSNVNLYVLNQLNNCDPAPVASHSSGFLSLFNCY